MTTSRTPTLLGAIAGFLAGATAVAIGTFFAAVTNVVSPIDAVGSTFIDHTPRWLKEWAIRTFGTNDKLALRTGIVLFLAIAALVIGAVATRRRWIGIAGIAAFGIVGAWAAAGRPNQSWGATVPSLLGAAAGVFVLIQMLSRRTTEEPAVERSAGIDRRRFLVTGGTAAVVAIGAGATASAIDDGRLRKAQAATQAPLPTGGSVETVAPPSSDATVDPDLPFVTPNADFYRIDTALDTPIVDAATWKCDIGGMVDHPFSFTYAELLAMPMVERVVTLGCVSNDVGGSYISNAVWRGVLLKDLLDRAGVQKGAEQVFSTSVDGWTSGFPVEVALDGRDAMIAVGMNGSTLPVEHGYPARLVVPGLYGYVSATKWLRQIQLTTWDQQGYWVPRGWARLGPVKTQSRIDVPHVFGPITAGNQKIAGVAWAQHVGIAKVEVRVDNGPWQVTTLGADVSNDAWREWTLDWKATPGTHTIEVQATDKSGYTQTAERSDVAPDGATGHHTIRVHVQG